MTIPEPQPCILSPNGRPFLCLRVSGKTPDWQVWAILIVLLFYFAYAIERIVLIFARFKHPAMAPDYADWLYWIVLGMETGVVIVIRQACLVWDKLKIKRAALGRDDSTRTGLVEITGPAYSFVTSETSPLSQRACVGFAYSIEEQDNTPAQRWLPQAQDASGKPFLVRGVAGDVTVNPSSATMVLEVDRDYDAAALAPMFPSQAEQWNWFCELEEMRSRLPRVNLRGREAILEHGETVYVLGKMNAHNGETAQFDAVYVSDHSLRTNRLFSSLSWKDYVFLCGGLALFVVCILLLQRIFSAANP